MWRFLLQENIRRYREQIAAEKDDERRGVLQQLLVKAQAELNEIEGACASQATRDDPALRILAERAIDEAMKLHRAQFGTLHIFDATLGSLVLLAQRNFRAEFLAYHALMKPDAGSISGQAFAGRCTIVVGDIEKDASLVGRRQDARDAGVAAIQASPLRDMQDRVIGVLSTQFTTPRRFSPQDVERMDRHARSVGAALEHHWDTLAAGGHQSGAGASTPRNPGNLRPAD